MSDSNEAKPKINPLLKLALDIGPLALWVMVYAQFGIFVATGILMAAVVAALILSYAITGQWPVMPVVTAIVVLVFGGLTLVLHDATFIKLKPTITYVLFGGTLLVGYLFDKPFLAIVLDSAFQLTEEGWRKLTLRWALFFFALAALNEVIWRTQSETFWVNFKLYGFVPIIFVFALLQSPLLKRYAAESAPTDT